MKEADHNPKKQRKETNKPAEFVVLLGRGKGYGKIFGNKIYRNVINKNKDEYQAIKSNNNKKDALARDVIRNLTAQGAIFCTKCEVSGQVSPATGKTVLDKVKQALREKPKIKENKYSKESQAGHDLEEEEEEDDTNSEPKETRGEVTINGETIDAFVWNFSSALMEVKGSCPFLCRYGIETGSLRGVLIGKKGDNRKKKEADYIEEEDEPMLIDQETRMSNSSSSPHEDILEQWAKSQEPPLSPDELTNVFDDDLEKQMEHIISRLPDDSNGVKETASINLPFYDQKNKTKQEDERDLRKKSPNVSSAQYGDVFNKDDSEMGKVFHDYFLQSTNDHKIGSSQMDTSCDLKPDPISFHRKEDIQIMNIQNLCMAHTTECNDRFEGHHDNTAGASPAVALHNCYYSGQGRLLDSMDVSSSDANVTVLDHSKNISGRSLPIPISAIQNPSPSSPTGMRSSFMSMSLSDGGSNSSNEKGDPKRK